jgi:hypothetical protein
MPTNGRWGLIRRLNGIVINDCGKLRVTVFGVRLKIKCRENEPNFPKMKLRDR